jgi:sec-independent protein translocase protein TatB
MRSLELLLILLVTLVVFGPNKLPMLAKHIASCFRYIQRAYHKIEQIKLININKYVVLEQNQVQAEHADLLYKKAAEQQSNSNSLQ